MSKDLYLIGTDKCYNPEGGRTRITLSRVHRVSAKSQVDS